MKKIVLLFISIFSILGLFTINIKADIVEYKNVITDDTSIEEDFEVLGLEIDDYYSPSEYDYSKWYVVAMSESYDMENKQIQTYFYLFNPELKIDNKPDSITLNYSLNYINYVGSFYNCNYYDELHCLIKIKGFKYDYKKDVVITISNIHTRLYIGEDSLNSGYDIIEEKDYRSSFESIISHNLSNESFNIELNFNSMLVIEDCKVVEIEIKEDDNFANSWADLWSFGKDGSLLAYFYNFNFPERIKPDKIDYAKFYYVYEEFEEVVLDGSAWEDGNLKDLGFNSKYEPYKNSLSKEEIINEYDDESKTLRVNKNSQELTFPTFYLGNRIVDKQFGTLKVDLDSSYFDYDCSVLLDTTIKESNELFESIIGNANHTATKYHYTTLNDIEMLELHYYCDGILYTCQVVSDIVEDNEIESGKAETPDLPDLIELPDWLEWLINFFSNKKNVAILVLVLMVLIVVVPLTISLIPVLAPIIPNIIKLILRGFKIILKGIITIIKVPFKIIGGILKFIKPKRKDKRYY